MYIYFIFLLIIVGAILLQIFLSRKINKWLGIILPSMTFIISFIFVFNIMNTPSIHQSFILSIITFFITNIPTSILIAIYFSCREKLKRNLQVEKMNIQDLE